MKNFSGVCQAAGADKPLRAFFIWITNIVTLPHWILFRFRLRKSRNRGFDKCCQVIPVIHIFDIEVDFGAVIWRLKDDFLQDSLAGLCHLHIEVVVADKPEEESSGCPSPGTSDDEFHQGLAAFFGELVFVHEVEHKRNPYGIIGKDFSRVIPDDSRICRLKVGRKEGIPE